MGIPSSAAKQIRSKVEATFNTAPGSSGGQLLRRVESTLDIEKDIFKSNEKRSDYQKADMRHGTRRTVGQLKCELSPKSYADFIGAALRKDFVAGASATGLAITIAGAGPTYTVTRGTGSWITDGFRVGDVARLTAGTFNAANLNKNLFIVSLTALALTVMPLNGVALIAEGPIATATASVAGKRTYVPATGHTDKSFAVEHYFADATPLISELYTGLKVNTIAVGLPPTGMATIDIDLMGPGSITTAAAAYYTAPTAPTSTGTVASVNGILMIDGIAVAICTGLNIKIDGGYGSDPVVGSNSMPGIFPGSVLVSGDFTAYFETAVFRDAFLQEAELTLALALSTDNSAAADFVSFVLPRIKLIGAKRNDGDKGIVVSSGFEALRYIGSDTSIESTTLVVQDSAA